MGMYSTTIKCLLRPAFTKPAEPSSIPIQLPDYWINQTNTIDIIVIKRTLILILIFCRYHKKPFIIKYVSEYLNPVLQYKCMLFTPLLKKAISLVRHFIHNICLILPHYCINCLNEVNEMVSFTTLNAKYSEVWIQWYCLFDNIYPRCVHDGGILILLFSDLLDGWDVDGCLTNLPSLWMTSAIWMITNDVRTYFYRTYVCIKYWVWSNETHLLVMV